MAQMKEQIQVPENNTTKQRRDSQHIRCTVQNTGNQDTHRIDWAQSKNEGRSEGYTKWKKENIQGTNSEGKETGTQINDLEHKKEINIQPEQNEERRIQKNEERLRNLQNILKRFNIWIIGVPEGEEEEQKIENN